MTTVMRVAMRTAPIRWYFWSAMKAGRAKSDDSYEDDPHPCDCWLFLRMSVRGCGGDTIGARGGGGGGAKATHPLISNIPTVTVV